MEYSQELCAVCGKVLLGYVVTEGGRRYHAVCLHEMKYHADDASADRRFSFTATEEIVMHVKKFNPLPGDTIVVTLGRLISTPEYERISYMLKQAFPAQKVLLLEMGDIRLENHNE